MPVPANPNECGRCAHDLKKDPPEPTKGHAEVDRDGVKLVVCNECGEVCQVIQPAPTAAPAAPSTPPPVTVGPASTEELAKAVATKVSSLRDEMIWKSLQQPGVVIRVVDGGYIIENRWGDEAVRLDIDQTLEKAREWLKPR